MVLMIAVSLAGCAGASATSRSTLAREVLGDVVRTVAGDRHNDINGFARSVVDLMSNDMETPATVSLVGIEEREAARTGDPFGTLTFRVQVPDTHTAEPFDGCYEIEFDRYGATDNRVWEGADYLREQSCPENVAPVVPPVDTSISYVVAANAEEAAVRVLSEATPAAESVGDGDYIASRILALLDVPTGEYEELAPPAVIVVSDRIGVAMGATPGDCVLVARVDGVVSRVRPASIRLEPGELGCRPETALMDPAELGPPH